MKESVLLCPPDHFRIAYEINPWMHLADPADPARASAQWEQLRSVLESLGLRVETVDGPAELPDMTFAANAGIVSGRRFFPSNFRHPERQPERERFIEWFIARGYSVQAVDSAFSWEGEGDVLDAGHVVIAAQGFRTDAGALNSLGKLLNREMVRVELIDPHFYHLDTCFFPLGPRSALYYPPALSEPSVTALAEIFPDLVAVPEVEARRFACNALLAGDSVILNDNCPETMSALRSRGLRPVPTPTSEFIKAGGSVKCLVLTLDRFQRPA